MSDHGPVWTLRQARSLNHCRICGLPNHWLETFNNTDTEYSHRRCVEASKPKEESPPNEPKEVGIDPKPASPLPWKWSNKLPCIWLGANDAPVGGLMDPDHPTKDPDMAYAFHAANSLPAKEAEIERLRAGLEKSVVLQSHYARLLNAFHGGERRTFNSADEWLARLDEILKGE